MGGTISGKISVSVKKQYLPFKSDKLGVASYETLTEQSDVSRVLSHVVPGDAAVVTEIEIARSQYSQGEDSYASPESLLNFVPRPVNTHCLITNSTGDRLNRAC